MCCGVNDRAKKSLELLFCCFFSVNFAVFLVLFSLDNKLLVDHLILLFLSRLNNNQYHSVRSFITMLYLFKFNSIFK